MHIKEYIEKLNEKYYIVLGTQSINFYVSRDRILIGNK